METAEATVNLYRLAESKARQSMHVDTALTELIDNALDADARNVRIEIKGRERLSVIDDGVGLPDVTALINFAGGHIEHATTRSGQYGIGFKDAALWLGGVDSSVTVKTLHGDRFTDATIEWALLRKTSRCMSLHTCAAGADDAQGTRLHIQPLRARIELSERRTALLDDLGYLYSPALKSGRTITLSYNGKDHIIRRWELPDLVDVVDQWVEVRGRRARVYAGLVAEGHRNARPGLTYAHGWRVIKRACRQGCGATSIDRICGIVQLPEKKRTWERTTNKNDLVDAEDLYDEVYRVLTPLLQKAQSQAHALEFEGSRAVVEAALNATMFGDGDEKARRNPANDKNGRGAEPTGKGGKHRRAKQCQPGDRFGGRASRVSLQWRTGWEPGKPIGEWSLANRIGVVELYADHPFVASTRGHGPTVYALAMAVIATRIDAQTKMSFLSEDALVNLASMTRNGGAIDGVAVEQLLDAAQ